MHSRKYTQLHYLGEVGPGRPIFSPLPARKYTVPRKNFLRPRPNSRSSLIIQSSTNVHVNSWSRTLPKVSARYRRPPGSGGFRGIPCSTWTPDNFREGTYSRNPLSWNCWHCSVVYMHKYESLTPRISVSTHAFVP